MKILSNDYLPDFLDTPMYIILYRKLFIYVSLHDVVMESVKSKIVKGPKDNKGRIRKFIQIPEVYYDDFNFGDIVRIEKVKINESQQES